MARNWTRDEIDLTIADYFAMLRLEIQRQPFVKAKHYRALLNQLPGRTKAAVEKKHQNITAVLRELDHPSIDGYKPLRNFQTLLWDAVVEHLDRDKTTEALVASKVSWKPSPNLEDDKFSGEVEAPAPLPASAGTKVIGRTMPGRRVDYLVMESRNRDLGRRGEEFVQRLEARRLHASGVKPLADKVEHVAHTRGDGLGYDVLSFETDGRERFIEVKTTTFARRQPFYVTRGELAYSVRSHNQYQIYRLFDFDERPGLFRLPGRIDHSCKLEPESYRARFA